MSRARPRPADPPPDAVAGPAPSPPAGGALAGGRLRLLERGIVAAPVAVALRLAVPGLDVL